MYVLRLSRGLCGALLWACACDVSASRLGFEERDSALLRLWNRFGSCLISLRATLKMFPFTSEKRFEFERVPQAEDCEQLLDHDQVSNDSRPAVITSCGPSWRATAIIVFSTAILSAALGALISRHIHLNADAFSILHTSQYCKLYSGITLVAIVLTLSISSYH
jgi:hypothetical protein